MNSKGKLSLLLAAGMVVIGTMSTNAADEKGKKAAAGAAKPAGAASEDVFYIFKDRGSRLNHYVPSGWMGDYGDLKMNQGWAKNASAAKEGKKDNKESTGPAGGE